jgi:thiol-disulfide isomerase/thioredoxin
MMAIKSIKAALCVALLALMAPTLVLANDPVTDPEFDTLSKSIPGFQRILNTPPVPETKFLKGARQAISLKEFSGKALLVNFWATWCTPCVREMPDLNQLSKDFGGESFEVVAIASGQQVGMNPDVFLKEKGLESLALYQDPHASLMKLFDTQTLPTTLIVDKQGRIRGGVRGAIDWNTDAARAAIAHLMEN